MSHDASATKMDEITESERKIRRVAVRSDGGLSALDRMLDAVREPRRRYALYYLQDTEPTDLDQLAHQVAAWETDQSPDEVDEALVEHVRADLYHNHLSKLDDYGIVEFDHRSKVIRFRKPSDEFLSLCSLCRSIENRH